MEKSDKSEAKQPGSTSQIATYQKIAAHVDELIEGLLVLTKSRNENIALGAYKVLINKILPDLRSTEVHGGVNADGTTEPIRLFINAGQGFIPATVTLQGSSTGSAAAPSPEVQGADLAQKSLENNNSDNGNIQASSS